jgi:hypothetical protein
MHSWKNPGVLKNDILFGLGKKTDQSKDMPFCIFRTEKLNLKIQLPLKYMLNSS